MIFSILTNILIWGSLLIILIRLVSTADISYFSRNKAISFILENKSRGLSDEVTYKSVIYLCLAALLFRMIVFYLSSFAVAFWSNSELTFNNLIQQYVQWDANNYQRIADLGYSGYNPDGNYLTLAFFPLYPWTARVFNIIFHNTYISLLVTSFLCYSIGCGFLYKLCAIDFGKSTAMKSVVYISVFPHALFFGTMMNESMLFMFTVITLLFIRRHKWWLVGIFGALAALSRLAGILLAFPALIEFIEYYKLPEKLKHKELKQTAAILLRKGSPVFIMLLGTFVYLYCNYRTTGEWFKFMEYQQTIWHHHSTYFGTGVRNIINNAINALKSGNSMITAAIHIPSVISLVFVLLSIVYGIRKSRSMYSIYLIMYFIVNMSVDWIISTPRYMVCAVPAFIYLAEFADRHRWIDPLITASMSICFGIYLTAYLFSKQIL